MLELGTIVMRRDILLKSYWELSYKGKFIRTLWMVPVTILILLILFKISTPFTIASAVFLFVLLIAQLIYNYTKWKVKSNSH